MTAWNICLTHDPVYGGLYRAVNDFAAAIPARTLSFDDGRRDRSGLTREDHACRVPCGTGPFSRDCFYLSSVAATEAERVVADAEMLVVHSMFRGHAPWAAKWAGRHARPFWAVPHGCLDPWGLRRHHFSKVAWLRWYGERFLGRAARIIFSTRREMEKAAPWLSRLGASGSLDVVHWPVHLPSLEGRDAARKTWRDRHAIPDEASLLLFVARLHTMKRPLETVAAFCRAAGPMDHLAVIGMDDDVRREDLERAIPSGRVGQVHAVGPLFGQDLHAAWLAADAFISLSFRENFGYSTAEALAYGLPVILSPGHDLAYDMPRSAEHEIACGWLLPDDSEGMAIAAITACVEAIRGRNGLARRMGEIGRRWVSDALAPEAFSTRLTSHAGR